MFLSFFWLEVMGNFGSFESYENIRNTKCPVSTYPAKEVALAYYACLCLLMSEKRHCEIKVSYSE